MKLGFLIYFFNIILFKISFEVYFISLKKNKNMNKLIIRDDAEN